MSAVTAGVKDVREATAKARQRLAERGQGTILFLDEVHRFNKAQQDALLPSVEEGLITLIGATTENPFFEVNAPLISRSTVFRLESLSEDDLTTVVKRALDTEQASADDDAIAHLVDMAGGDARAALTTLEVALALAHRDERPTVTLRDVEQMAAGRAETAIFSLTDAWGRRDVAGVLSSAEAIMERSHRPRSGELMRMIGSMVNHVGRVRRCQRLAEQGVRARDAAGTLKMHPFAAEKAFAQAANFSADELGYAIVRLAELDAASKGGSRLPADLELERALVDITRSRAA